MKISKTILSLLIITVFLIPLTGNTALADDLTNTYYFNSYDTNEAWTTNPGYMVDGSISTFAKTMTLGDVELCDDNSYPGDPPSLRVSKVEIRAYGSSTSLNNIVALRPVFCGTTDGLNYYFTLSEGWSQWYDITDDPYGPGEGNWIADDIDCLDCDVEAYSGIGSWEISKVEIRVTW